jgi:hypothetical protein
MPELLLAATELLATAELLPTAELPELPEVPEAPVVTPEVEALLAALDVVPLPSALPPAPPMPVDSSIRDPFAQAEAMITQVETIKNPVVHHASSFVLRRLRAMLMSP